MSDTIVNLEGEGEKERELEQACGEILPSHSKRALICVLNKSLATTTSNDRMSRGWFRKILFATLVGRERGPGCY